MAKLIFTEEDERLIESLLEEFDPAKRMAHLQLRDLVPATTWDALVGYQRSIIRLYIEAGLITKALTRVGRGLTNTPDDYDLRAFALSVNEGFGPSDEEAGYPKHWSRNLPSSAVEEYENVSHDLNHEPLARVLGIEFEPVS